MQTIEDWLSQLGLSKYMEAFVQDDVDLPALPHITEADLQELGVSLGCDAKDPVQTLYAFACEALSQFP
jgi:hypothetical protein